MSEPSNAQKVPRKADIDSALLCALGLSKETATIVTDRIEELECDLAHAKFDVQAALNLVSQLEKENEGLKSKLDIARIVIGMALDEANIYFSKDLLTHLERAQAALTPKEKETK